MNVIWALGTVVTMIVMLLVQCLVYGYLVDVRMWRHDTRAWWCGYGAAWLVPLAALLVVTAVTR